MKRLTSKLRPYAVGSAIGLVGAVLALIVFDVVYTLFVLGAWHSDFWLDRAHIPRQYSSADPELGFVRKPFVRWRGAGAVSGQSVEYRTDENGFRNPPYLRSADIAFIGDSYTEAARIAEHDTFVARLGKATGLRVVNLGRGAYGPQQERIVLEKYALEYRPRFIVWVVFPGNDLDDAYQFLQWKRGGVNGFSLPRRYLNNSLVRSVVENFMNEHPESAVKAELRTGTGAIEEMYVRYTPRSPESHTTGLRELRRVLREGQEICRGRQIKLGVAVMPTMLRVMKPYVRLIGLELGPNPPFYLEEYVSRWCEEIGCSYVDLLGPMQRAAAKGERDIFIPNDEHLSPRGHALVTEVMVAWLREQGVRADASAQTRGAKPL